MSDCDLPGRSITRLPALEARGGGGTAPALGDRRRRPPVELAAPRAQRMRPARRPRRWRATEPPGGSARRGTRARSSRVNRLDALDACPWRDGRTDADAPYSISNSASTARTAGLSSSCRIAVMQFRPGAWRLRAPGRRDCARCRHDRRARRRSLRTGTCTTTISRVTDVATRSATPRSSSSSARTSADRVVVPRSMTRPSEIRQAGRSAGSCTLARTESRVDRDGRRDRRLLHDDDAPLAARFGPATAARAASSSCPA